MSLPLSNEKKPITITIAISISIATGLVSLFQTGIASAQFETGAVEKPERAERIGKRECMEAMRKAPLRPTMTWEKLRELTREP